VVQVGFDKPYLIEVETSGRLNTEPERFACEIRANYNPISTRQIQAHLAGATPNLYDARIAGNRSVDQPREFTPLGACSQPTQGGAWRKVGERRPLIKAPHNFGSRIAQQS
jgi:hypothetical protein